MVHVQKSFAVGPTQWENHAHVEAGSGDGAVPHPRLQRLMGFAGQPDKKAAEAWNNIVTVMYAQACSGKMKPEEAVKWAAGELGKVYTGA